jgi:hypothetical protein
MSKSKAVLRQIANQKKSSNLVKSTELFSSLKQPQGSMQK